MRLLVQDPKQPTVNKLNNYKGIRDLMPEISFTQTEFRP